MALVVTAALTFTPISHDIQPPCPEPLEQFWSTCITRHAARWIPTQYREEASHRDRTGPDVVTPPPTNLKALVAAYFPPWEIDRALSVIQCESLGDPNARNSSSGAAGLFQHLPRYWPARSSAAGWAGADIYDPTANVAVAAWLWGQTGTWQHWTCKP